MTSQRYFNVITLSFWASGKYGSGSELPRPTSHKTDVFFQVPLAGDWVTLLVARNQREAGRHTTIDSNAFCMVASHFWCAANQTPGAIQLLAQATFARLICTFLTGWVYRLLGAQYANCHYHKEAQVSNYLSIQTQKNQLKSNSTKLANSDVADSSKYLGWTLDLCDIVYAGTRQYHCRACSVKRTQANIWYSHTDISFSWIYKPFPQEYLAFSCTYSALFSVISRFPWFTSNISEISCRLLVSFLHTFIFKTTRSQASSCKDPSHTQVIHLTTN